VTKPPPKDRLISLPIFWQVLGLALGVLVLALGINTLVVLKAPEPPPAGYTLAEAVAALKSGSVRLNNGRLLTAATVSAPPPFVAQNADHTQRQRPFETDLAIQLAAELHVPADTVWVAFDHRMYDLHRVFHGPPGNGGPMPPDGHPAPPLNSVRGFHVVTDNADHPPELVFPQFFAAWKLSDGRYRVISPPQLLIAPWQQHLLLGFGITALLILPLAWLLSQRLSRPIIAFSEAAARIGVEDNAPQVAAIGPREVRQAADVLNAMQARIRKQIESRTALMGAIAHDLKTPLARMRLRIEDLPEPVRGKLSDDIAHMDGLIKSAMSFTSAHKLSETVRPLDLSALAETLAEDLSAMGSMAPPLVEPGVMVRGDSVALKRIITNLVENAVRYAGGCRIELATRGRMAELRVIDHGPGLPPDMLETVFEPFYRMESSRNRDTGGTGLGLSVARALAEAQGATLTLHNRYEGAAVTGLEARLTLPVLSRA